MIFIAFMSITLAGCSNSISKPNSYIVGTFEHPSEEEATTKFPKSIILKGTINALHDNKPLALVFSNSPNNIMRSKVKNNTISFSEGVNAIYMYEYIFDGDTIRMNDLSYGTYSYINPDRDAYCSHCKDYGFVKYINTFNVNLAQEYQKRLDWYALFIDSYDKRRVEFERISNNFIPTINDKTGLLTEKVIEGYQKLDSVHWNDNFRSFVIQELSQFELNDPVKAAEKHFNVYVGIDNLYGRYIAYFQPSGATGYFSAFSDGYNFDVDYVEYDYIPNPFYLKDTVLGVSVNNGLVDIRNYSKSYVKINSISIYYGNEVQTFHDLDLKAPPITAVKHEISSKFYSREYRYKKVSSKDDEVNFGIAISYSTDDGDKTLYKEEFIGFSELD